MQQKGEVYPFIVVLKNTQAKRIRRVGMFMGILGVFMLAYRGLAPVSDRLNLFAAAIAAILTGWNIYASRQGKKVWYRSALSVIALGLMLLAPFQWPGILFLIMAFLEKPASKPVEICFAEDHVRFNGMSRQKHNWSEFQGVILRDNILTLDFRNNKLMQLETDEEEDDDYEEDEKEFNAWVQLKVEQANHIG